MNTPSNTASQTDHAAERLRAVIATDRAQRYLAQMVQHASAIVSSNTHAGERLAHASRHVQIGGSTLTVSGLGRCTLSADESHLTAQITATDAASAWQLAELITADLLRFSYRDPLAISWDQW